MGESLRRSSITLPAIGDFFRDISISTTVTNERSAIMLEDRPDLNIKSILFITPS